MSTTPMAIQGYQLTARSAGCTRGCAAVAASFQGFAIALPPLLLRAVASPIRCGSARAAGLPTAARRKPIAGTALCGAWSHGAAQALAQHCDGGVAGAELPAARPHPQDTRTALPLRLYRNTADQPRTRQSVLAGPLPCAM